MNRQSENWRDSHCSDTACERQWYSNRISLLSTSAPRQRPSFNCSLAKSLPEMMICNAPRLAEADRKLANVYRTAKAATSNSKEFRQQGKSEWSWRENNCKNRQCLFAWFGKRQASLTLAAQRSETVDCFLADSAIQVDGNLARKTFPGPPNYSSVEDGDKPETYWILTAETPRCLVSQSMEDLTQYFLAVPDATRFQLRLTSQQYKKHRDLLGSNVSVNGTLERFMTGHHHGDALIKVDSLN